MSRRECQRPGLRQSLTTQPPAQGVLRPTHSPRRPLAWRWVALVALALCLLLKVGGGAGWPTSSHAAPAMPDPPALIRVGHLGGQAETVAAAPSRLIAGEGASLVLFDTTTLPPTRLADVALPGAPQNVDVDGDRVYAAMGSDGLAVMNLEASSLRLVGIAAARPARDAAAGGDHVYVAADIAGLRLFNVANPEQPVQVGSVASGGRVIAVAARPPYVYLADQDVTLAVVDASDPSAPRVVHLMPGDARTLDLVVDGERLYLATNYGLRVLSLANPAQPVEIGRYPEDRRYTLYSLAVSGDRVYVGHYQSGVEEFVVDAEGRPAPVCPGCPSPYPNPGRANVAGMAADQARAYVADGDALRVLAPAPGDPGGQPLRIVATLEGFSLPTDVALDGAYAYVAAQGTGLAVVAVHAAPQVIYRYDLVTLDIAPDVRGVAVSPSAVFLAGADGLSRYDRADPARPTYRDTLPLGPLTSAAAVAERAFAAGGNRIYAARLTGDDVIAATVGLTDIKALAAVGDQVLAVGDGGLWRADWPVDGAATPLAGYAAPDYAAVSVTGTLVATAHADGIDLLRLWDMDTVTRVGGYATSAAVIDVVLDGHNLYALDAAGRVMWLDVTDPVSPRLLDAASVGGAPTSLAAGGGLLGAADLNGGLFLWRTVHSALYLPWLIRGQ